MLSRLFLEYLSGEADPPVSTPHLEETLRALVDDGRTTWPDLGLTPEIFIQHLAQRLPKKGDVLQALQRTHGADLYIACACAHGVPTALTAFNRHFMIPLGTYLARRDASAGHAEDLKQAVSERVLVDQGGGLPRVGTYTGAGPLSAWLRIVAVRLAVNLRKTLNGDAGSAVDPTDLPMAAPDPEVGYLKARYGREFKGALAQTLARLSPRSASVLRLYFLQGLTARAIGTIHNVSDRTVHRWLTMTRQRVLSETHRRLRKRLDVSTSQLDSLIAVFYTELRLEIEKFSDRPVRS